MGSNNITLEHFSGKLVSNKKFNILYLNINSLLNKISDIELLIAECGRDGVLVHFLALTEVRLDDLTSNYYNLQDYNSYFCNKQRNSGGVVLYCHSSLSCTMQTQVSIMNVDLVCVSITTLDIKVCVFYKQPGVPASTFFSILDSFLDDYRNCIMVGDANIDLLKPNPESNNLWNMTLSNSYYILNKIDSEMATRIAHRDNSCSRTIIDHVYSDITNFSYSISIQDTPISDHRMILISFDNHRNISTTNCPASYSSKKINFKKFRNIIMTSHLLNTAHPESLPADACLEYMRSQLDICTTNVIKPVPNDAKPWINEELIKLITDRDQYFKLHKKYPYNEYILKKYKTLKKVAEKKRTSLRNTFFANLISKNIHHTRNLWATFNFIIHNKHKTQPTIDTIQDPNGQPLQDNYLKANVLNNYFSSIGSALANDLLASNPQNRNCTLNYQLPNSIVLQNFSLADTQRAIDSLKSTGSSEDNINAKILKGNSDILVPILTKIINSSFNDGIFPDTLKLAKLVPIFKAGDATLPKNYRPISILSSISKIFERLLYNSLESFFIKYKVINKNQYGFQKGSGTLSAATQLISLLQNALDNKTVATSIFIDLQKAFDTIPHNEILDKLFKYGIRGTAHKILQSYLTNRKQYVSLANSLSNTMTVSFGIPQGSILGPLLFLVYINDIFAVPFGGYIQLFADDAVLVYTGNDLPALLVAMQDDLNLLCTWLFNNLLTINADKTKFMIFHSPHKHIEAPNRPLLINNKQIESVDEFKYLGLIIHHTLKWNAHIDNVIKKTAPLVGILRRLNRCTPTHLLRSIYFAHVHSRLSYLTPIWGSSTPAYKLNDLQVLQNKAIRSIFNIDYFTNKMHTRDILQKYQILNVIQLVDYNTITFYYKIVNNLVKIQHVFARNTDIHNYQTRNMNNIRIPKSNNNYGQFSTFNHAARLFNAIDNTIKEQCSLNLFKSRLKKHILSLEPA